MRRFRPCDAATQKGLAHSVDLVVAGSSPVTLAYIKPATVRTYDGDGCNPQNEYVTIL